jgi:hypothetical protein
LTRLHDVETTALEHCERSHVRARSGDATARRIDRVALDDGRAVCLGVGDRRAEERRCDALAAPLASDDEADDRPNRRFVDPGEDLRALEPDEVLARPEADPADRRRVA